MGIHRGTVLARYSWALVTCGGHTGRRSQRTHLDAALHVFARTSLGLDRIATGERVVVSEYSVIDVEVFLGTEGGGEVIPDAEQFFDSIVVGFLQYDIGAVVSGGEVLSCGAAMAISIGQARLIASLS